MKLSTETNIRRGGSVAATELSGNRKGVEKAVTKKRVILAGGSGFLGQSLALLLAQRGYEVVILSRSPVAPWGMAKQLQWNGKTVGPWADHLDGAEAVVNLAGRSVNCRYTPANRREIVDSRVHSVQAIAEAIAHCDHPPKAFVQAGSLAIYGDAGDRWCDESAPHGKGFSVETCLRWEEAFHGCQTGNTRKVLLRIGFALGKDGGALEVLTKLAKLYLGGFVGNGRQYISWLHAVDLNHMFLWAIEKDELAGSFNATGPNPVTNAAFMRELRRVLKRPWSPPAPALAVRVASRFMGTEASLALTGRRCVPKRFAEKGLEFKFPKLGDALADLLD